MEVEADIQVVEQQLSERNKILSLAIVVDTWDLLLAKWEVRC